MGSAKDLALLIQSGYGLIAADTVEEERLETVLDRIATDLKMPFHVWSVTTGLREQGDGSPFLRRQPPPAEADSQSPLRALTTIAEAGDGAIYLMKDLHRYLEQAAVVRRLQDLVPGLAGARRVIVFFTGGAELPRPLQALAASFTLDLPAAEELRAIVKRVTAQLVRTQTARVSLTADDTERLVERMRGFTALEAERALTRAAVTDGALTREDVEVFIDIRKELVRKEGALEYIAPEDNLAAVGGFARLKEWLAKRKRAFEPAAREFGIVPPKGMLLLGVQGCGKTLLARAVAREWDLPLLKMEAGRLYDKFIGESEKNLEKALRTAEAMAPCVLMIDELEKALSGTSGIDSDGGLSRRIFGRLLGWLQDRKAPVFVVATCNDITSLPPELTRKGRFDEIFFIDLPTREERKAIFALHLGKRKRTPGLFDLENLAAACEGFSGAEIEQVVVGALYTAFSRGGELTTAILAEEIRATRPLSVTRREEIESLRTWASERTVPAS